LDWKVRGGYGRSPESSPTSFAANQREKEKKKDSPRIINLGLPFRGPRTNLIRFGRVPRRGDQKVGEEGADGVAVAGQRVVGYGCCVCWSGREGSEVRG
jgi:hypothetical protein